MGGDSSPPPAPNYVGQAEATAAGNLEAMKYQTQANRVTQNNPWGRTSWTNNQTVDQAGYDKALADYNAKNSKGTWVEGTPGQTQEGEWGSNNIPGTAGHWEGATTTKDKAPDLSAFSKDNWEQTTTLDPRLQSALESQLAVTQGRSAQAQSMLQGVKDAYNTPYSAPDRNSYTSGVPGVDTGMHSGSQDLSFDPNGQRMTTNYDRFGGAGTGGIGLTNQRAPQFDASQADLYAQKAYKAQMALLRPDLERQQSNLQNNLALQGLNVGTEANQQAQLGQSLALAAQQDQLANSSYLSGANVAQSNYNTQLGGWKASNEAQQQAFNQGKGSFDSNLQALNSENLARGTDYAQQLQRFQANNTANSTQFNQDLQALQSRNQAQQQAYNQAMQNFSVDTSTAASARARPLNELNSLLSGQAVQAPAFQSFALQGNTAGADYATAGANQGKYDQSTYNAQQARDAADQQAMMAAAGTAASLYGTAAAAGLVAF